MFSEALRPWCSWWCKCTLLPPLLPPPPPPTTQHCKTNQPPTDHEFKEEPGIADGQFPRGATGHHPLQGQLLMNQLQQQSHAKHYEVRHTQYSKNVSISLLRWDCTVKSAVCIGMQFVNQLVLWVQSTTEGYIRAKYRHANRSHTLIKDPVDRVRVQWIVKHQNDPACTKSVWAFKPFKLDTIQRRQHMPVTPRPCVSLVASKGLDTVHHPTTEKKGGYILLPRTRSEHATSQPWHYQRGLHFTAQNKVWTCNFSALTLSKGATLYCPEQGLNMQLLSPDTIKGGYTSLPRTRSEHATSQPWHYQRGLHFTAQNKVWTCNFSALTLSTSPLVHTASPMVSPWYNHNGWMGVKNKATYLLAPTV